MQNIKNLGLVLDKKLSSAKRVIIIPHLEPDFDAIGSAIGLSVLASRYKKESFILVNDSIIGQDVKMVIDSSKDKGFNYIDKSTYLDMKSSNDLMILTDVNKTNRICLNEELRPKKTIVIDHHNEDEYTVKTKNKFIDQSISSASEIVTKLLHLMKIKYGSDIANYLLAGIYLDTTYFSQKVSSSTMKMVIKLLENGASIERVSEFFTEDFLIDRKIQRLLDKTVISTFSMANVSGEKELYTKEELEKISNYLLNYKTIMTTFSMAIVIGGEEIYTREELAKAANYLLKYKTDASLAIGKIGNNITAVSARSKGKVNVGEIMRQLNGGGNFQSAAANLEGISPMEVNKKLEKTLIPKI